MAGGFVVGCSGSGVSVQTIDPTGLSSSSGAASTALLWSDTPATAAPSTTPTSSPPTSVDTESADRAAVEAQWIKSWDVYLEIARTPPEEREELASTVTVDPTKSKMLADALEFDRQGLETYGQLGHRISWPQPINGSDWAVIDDCQDRSASGAMETATGTKKTVGVARDHYQGGLTRGEDGIWRVANVYYLRDEPC
jgi:hypothetical protein